MAEGGGGGGGVGAAWLWAALFLISFVQEATADFWQDLVVLLELMNFPPTRFFIEGRPLWSPVLIKAF